MAFPESFPLMAIPTVVGYLRGVGVGRRAAAEAAYDLLGYGCNVLIPADGSPSLAVMSDDYAGSTDVQLAVRLEDLAANLNASSQAAFALPPWLIPVVLEVLRRVLTS